MSIIDRPRILSVFDYHQAFSRNIGWVTKAEQQQLRESTVAVGGCGAAGGAHLLALARMGVGGFHISDFDEYDMVNFNRQPGATMSTIGRPKAEVMAEMVREINPEARITLFSDGVTPENVDRFLDGVAAYADGLDFFAFPARAMVFERCASKQIPALTAAPLGMGAASLNFLPGGISFEDFFGWEGRTDEEKAIRMMVGLSPARLQISYLADPSAVDLKAGKGPSTTMAIHLVAGVVATDIVKVILGRGKVICAPHGLHFDAYKNKLRRTWRPGGHRHPLQRAALAIVTRKLKQMGAGS
jgi:molybdopterin/thiamine biosynthesis adenylyltransferase